MLSHRRRIGLLTAAAIALGSSVVAAGCSSPGRSSAGNGGSLPNHPKRARTGAGSGTTLTPGGVARAPINPNGIALGVYVKQGNAGLSSFGPINQFVSQLGRTPAIIQTFEDWQSGGGSFNALPTAFLNFVSGLGAMPMITWQAEQDAASSSQSGGTHARKTSLQALNQPTYSDSALAGGSEDQYITQWAQAAKSYGKVFYVRLMHEMNDQTYPWSIGVNGNTDPAQYVAAFRHVVDIFRSVGATNVRFVWCVGAFSSSRIPLQSFFPGDSYADWVSIDGYNRDAKGKGWQTFADVFSQSYATLTSISQRPVMIAETGTVEDPSDPSRKAQWITTGFLTTIPTEFPRIKAVLYFDAPGRNYTYPLDSSAQAFAAFKAVAQSSLYQGAAPTTPADS